MIASAATGTTNGNSEDKAFQVDESTYFMRKTSTESIQKSKVEEYNTCVTTCEKPMRDLRLHTEWQTREF